MLQSSKADNTRRLSSYQTISAATGISFFSCRKHDLTKVQGGLSYEETYFDGFDAGVSVICVGVYPVVYINRTARQRPWTVSEAMHRTISGLQKSGGR